MSRNRIIHNVQDVFVGSAPDEADDLVTGIVNHQVLKRLTRVQNFNYSIDLPQQDALTLGRSKPFSRRVNEPPAISVSFSYLLNGVDNERRIGLNVGSIEDRIYTSDFSAGSDGWTGGGHGNVSSPHSVGGEGNAMRLNSISTSDTVHYAKRAVGFTTVGKRYKLTGYGLIDEAATNVDKIRFYDGIDYLIGNCVDGTKGTWQSFSAEFTAQTDFMSFYMIGAGGTVFAGDTTNDKIYLKDIVVTDITEVKEFIIPRPFDQSVFFESDLLIKEGDINVKINKAGVSGAGGFYDDNITNCSISVSCNRSPINYVGHKLTSDKKINLPVAAE